MDLSPGTRMRPLSAEPGMKRCGEGLDACWLNVNDLCLRVPVPRVRAGTAGSACKSEMMGWIGAGF